MNEYKDPVILYCQRINAGIWQAPDYLHLAFRDKVFKQMAKEKLTHPFFTDLELQSSLYQQEDSDLLT